MVSGTSWPNGDPFLQRQNEPTIAVSSRNPLHLLAGANDYRTVDLPGLPNGETGDAWLGVFKSYDGGQTWTSTLLPGCPQNIAQCGGAPALKPYAAGADPVVRPGSSGMFYYSGLAFTRTSPQQSALFVSRFIDNNNEENGDPIKFVNTVVIQTGTGASFIDKPWLAVDIPRGTATNCIVAAPQSDGSTVQQIFRGGNLYIAYTTFAENGQPPSQIQFVRSTDCGSTWSKPLALSDNIINQGATLAIDPNSGALYVAWRRFLSNGLLDAIMIAKSTDGGQTFAAPLQVTTINPFDQGTTDFSFRTNAYPAMAVDGAGRVYLAWSERNMGSPASAGDARIVLTTSSDGGQTWTRRYPVNDYPGRGHQYMPAMAFGGGKLMIVFYDLREDATTGSFTPLGQGHYAETRVPAGDLATAPPHPEKVFTPYVLDAAPANLNEGGLLRRHTVDVWSAQAVPGDQPSFNTARVSQYIFGSVPGDTAIQQLQVNPPNFPLFSGGTEPFVGDYLDIAASPTIVPGAQPGTWKFNTDPSPSIEFQAAWADNRDVRPPANGDWTDYTPPVSVSTTGISIYDPTKPQPSCITGQTGMRNENIYTSRITQGLAVSSPSNSKALGQMQRAFPVTVENSTSQIKTFRLSIVNQPPGGKASFLQFPTAGLPDPLTVLDVTIPPVSSISRMVFVTSSAALAPIQVSVAEISAPGAVSLRPGGLQGSVVLNPDPLNPANPAIANTEIFNPAIANPAIANPAIANPAIANPAIANPAIANPAIANPAIANLSASNADIANPAIANPAIANPAIANPAIANTAITDANWALTNSGNSAGTYSLHFLTDTSIPSRVLSQLIVNKVYNTPVANGCSLVTQPQTVVLANIPNPPLVQQQAFTQTAAGRTVSSLLRRHRKRLFGVRTDSLADPASASDITNSSLDDATVSIGPGETVYVTLRFFNTDATQPLGFDPAKDITTVSVSQAVDTGGTEPPVASSRLISATGSLAPGVIGAKYDDSLQAIGGQPPYTWSLVSGSLPAGLTLASNGEITGTVSGPGGVFNFVVQVTDSSSPTSAPVQESLSIEVSGAALAFTGVAASGPSGATALVPGQSITVTATVSSSGVQADNVIPQISVIASGSAGARCGGPQPASATLAQGTQQTFTFTCGSLSGSGTLAFAVSLTATDHALGLSLSVSPATSNAVTLLSAAPTVTATATAGGSAYAPLTWTNQNVVVTFTCTPAAGVSSTQQVTVASEGAGQTVTTTCTDPAGNSTGGSFSGIQIDKTPPQVTASATAGGQPYTSGIITNQPVTVTFTCTDTGSGVAQQSPTQVIQPPAVGQTITGTCTDRAGNTAVATFGGITSVAAAPDMSVTYSGGYTPGSVTTQPVTVTFGCTPAGGLGVAFLSPPVTVSAAGANQTVSGRCTDVAGNSNTITAGPITIQTSAAPTITLQSLPQSSSGWYNAPVTITWLCTDPDGTNTTLAKTVSTEGANQVATVSCTNHAGVSASASQTVSIDLTPPVIHGAASPAVPGSGWYTTPVTVTFTCTDTLSGVAAGYPTGGTMLSADTNGTVVNGACRDVAGNVANATVGPIRIDRTPPLIAFQSVSPVSSFGWANGPVTVTWTCTDSGSGPVSAAVTQQVTGQGSNHSATGTCTDVAGNTASNTHNGIKIDTTSPEILFVSPVNGFTYPLGFQVVASYNCTDNQSGIASCTGTASNGAVLQLNTPGPQTFTVTAVDKAGNQTVVTHTYTVGPGGGQ